MVEDECSFTAVRFLEWMLRPEHNTTCFEPTTSRFRISWCGTRLNTSTITSLLVKQDSIDMGVSIFLLPVPRGGATIRTGSDKWQRRNCIISVSTKRKEKWNESLASFFYYLSIYFSFPSSLCGSGSLHGVVLIAPSLCDSQDGGTDGRTFRDSWE
jgi:hypothetical protein